jgi:hypothetical protein
LEYRGRTVGDSGQNRGRTVGDSGQNRGRFVVDPWSIWVISGPFWVDFRFRRFWADF